MTEVRVERRGRPQPKIDKSVRPYFTRQGPLGEGEAKEVPRSLVPPLPDFRPFGPRPVTVPPCVLRPYARRAQVVPALTDGSPVLPPG